MARMAVEETAQVPAGVGGGGESVGSAGAAPKLGGGSTRDMFVDRDPPTGFAMDAWMRLRDLFFLLGYPYKSSGHVLANVSTLRMSVLVCAQHALFDVSADLLAGDVHELDARRLPRPNENGWRYWFAPSPCSIDTYILAAHDARGGRSAPPCLYL